MAGMFYSLQEAAERLGIDQDAFKDLVTEGKIREFRDGPNLLFKVNEVEAMASEIPAAEPQQASEPEAIEIEPLESTDIEPEPVEMEESEFEISEPQAPEPEVSDIEPLEFDVPELDSATPEEPNFELEPETPEPQPTEPDISEFDTSEFMAMDSTPTEESAPDEGMPDFGTAEFDLSEPETEQPEVADFDLEPEPELPEVPPSEQQAGTSEILLAPETGAPLPPSELTDADTAITGEGVNLLGDTDQDYEITDDTLGETTGSLGLTGTTPEASIEEIEGDINLDSFGSGSGLLDLSLQADDTSLGGILDEIYTSEGDAPEPSETGTTDDVSAEAGIVQEEDFGGALPTAQMAPVGMARMVAIPPDAQSNTLGMLLLLPLLMVLYTAIVAVAGMKGVNPSILSAIQSYIWYIVGGAIFLAFIIVGAAFMVGRDKSTAGTKPKKAKKEKPKKEKKSLFGRKSKKKGDELPPPPEDLNLDDLD